MRPSVLPNNSYSCRNWMQSWIHFCHVLLFFKREGSYVQCCTVLQRKAWAWRVSEDNTGIRTVPRRKCTGLTYALQGGTTGKMCRSYTLSGLRPGSILASPRRMLENALCRAVSGPNTTLLYFDLVGNPGDWGLNVTTRCHPRPPAARPPPQRIPWKSHQPRIHPMNLSMSPS